MTESLTESDAERAHRQYYVVTEDLQDLIGTWCDQMKFEKPAPEFFNLLRLNFKTALSSLGLGSQTRQALELRYLPRDDWRFDHLKRAKVTKAGDNAFWISLDKVYCPDADASIEVNRVFDDKNDGTYSPGPRINLNDVKVDGITTQMGRCLDEYRDRCRGGSGVPTEVVLADDGTYSGGTVIRILEDLDAHGIHVTELRLTFCTVEALRSRFSEYFSHRDPDLPPISVSSAMIVDKPLLMDWVCERDFYVGAPRSGRTAGRVDEGGGTPHRLQFEEHSSSIGIPYLTHWSHDIHESASLAMGDIKEFSARMTDLSIRLWSEVERLNIDNERLRGGLRVGHLPRYPCPIETYDGQAERPLVEFLEAHELHGFGPTRGAKRRDGVWDAQT